MAHAFKTIPARPTFGTLTKAGYQSDYISNKKFSDCRNLQTNAAGQCGIASQPSYPVLNKNVNILY